METSVQFGESINNLPNISSIKQCVDKLKYCLDYDRCEIDRLRADLEHILDVNVDEYNKRSFFSALSIKSATKNNQKLTNLNTELLDACDNATDAECIQILNIYISRIAKIQQEIANNRYNIRNYVLNPYSNIVKGLIIMLFNLLETDWQLVRTSIDNINIYLNRQLNQSQLCDC